MKSFTLSRYELWVIYTSLLLFVGSGIYLIRRHYDVVKSAYDITHLKRSVARSKERIEGLKVTRARIITPEYLEQVAGRSGYTQPSQEQLILLFEGSNEEERGDR